MDMFGRRRGRSRGPESLESSQEGISGLEEQTSLEGRSGEGLLEPPLEQLDAMGADERRSHGEGGQLEGASPENPNPFWSSDVQAEFVQRQMAGGGSLLAEEEHPPYGPAGTSSASLEPPYGLDLRQVGPTETEDLSLDETDRVQPSPLRESVSSGGTLSRLEQGRLDRESLKEPSSRNLLEAVRSGQTEAARRLDQAVREHGSGHGEGQEGPTLASMQDVMNQVLLQTMDMYQRLERIEESQASSTQSATSVMDVALGTVVLEGQERQLIRGHDGSLIVGPPVGGSQKVQMDEMKKQIKQLEQLSLEATANFNQAAAAGAVGAIAVPQTAPVASGVGVSKARTRGLTGSLPGLPSPGEYPVNPMVQESLGGLGEMQVSRSVPGGSSLPSVASAPDTPRSNDPGRARKWLEAVKQLGAAARRYLSPAGGSTRAYASLLPFLEGDAVSPGELAAKLANLSPSPEMVSGPGVRPQGLQPEPLNPEVLPMPRMAFGRGGPGRSAAETTPNPGTTNHLGIRA